MSSVRGAAYDQSKQQQFQREAGGYRTMAGLAQVISSILSIIPDMGAPTAMKFGGSQLGVAGRSVAEGFSALAAYDDTQASMASAEASNRRRDQEWTHQVETAKREVAQIDSQIAAAQIRRGIALEAQTIHERSTAQIEETSTSCETGSPASDGSPGCRVSCRSCTAWLSTPP